MSNFLFKSQFHQFFCGWRHILKTLPEGHDCKSKAFKVLHHLYSTPAVKGYFTDVIFCTEFLDKSFDESVMYDISLGGFEEALLLP